MPRAKGQGLENFRAAQKGAREHYKTVVMKMWGAKFDSCELYKSFTVNKDELLPHWVKRMVESLEEWLGKEFVYVVKGNVYQFTRVK